MIRPFLQGLAPLSPIQRQIIGARDAALRILLDPGRPLLHAWRLHLPETVLSPELIVSAPLPADLAAVLAALAIPPPSAE